jgi:hypothetical protein
MLKSKAKPHPLDDILSETVTPRGRSRAVRESGPPRETEAPPPRPSRRGASSKAPLRDSGSGSDDSWNATHDRVTFHCPIALRDLIYNEVKERTKSLSPRERRAFGRTRVIVEILARHYGVKLSS